MTEPSSPAAEADMRAAARAAIAGPARAIAILSGLTLALFLLGMVGILRQLLPGGQMSIGQLILPMVMIWAGSVAMVIAWRDARALARLERRSAGSRGALLLCIPFLCPLAPIGLLIAIWTFRVMGQEPVARAFGD